jgi:hypothetical protein
MPQSKSRWSSSKDWNKFARYRTVLDPADTIYATNQLIGYFRIAEDAPHLMRLQKEEDLKRKGLWDSEYQPPFVLGADILDSEFGINIYAVGSAVESRRKQQHYQNLLDLTSSHINSGGWQCSDFVVTFTIDHSEVKLIEAEPPLTEFVLGFIRLDSGTLNNAPLQRFLGMNRLTGDFANQHLLNAKVIVPTQPFGSLLRGGKLLALISISNELRVWFNDRYSRNVAVFYTTSLYGSSKSSSQYDQLDKFLFHIGDTDASFPLRIKDPHKKNLIDWMDSRGISRYQFIFTGSSKADRSHAAIVDYVRWCLWKHQSDSNIKQLLDVYDQEIEKLSSEKTERKRCYVSTYGHDEWDEILVNPNPTSNTNFDLMNLVDYWKSKVFKQKSWGMRKILKETSFPIRLRYDLLNQQLKEPSFNQVR